MSTYESSYTSLLQGVSQQNPDMRLPGQVTAQENMVSDPVTNPRRRPGAQVRSIATFPNSAPGSMRSWFTDIAGVKVHIFANTLTGALLVLNSDYELIGSAPAIPYLIAPSPQHLRAATVGDEFYILNTSKQPSVTGTYGTQDPAKGCFAFVVSGAFSREYAITVSDSGGNSVTATYSTPNGSTAAHAAESTGTRIATELKADLDASGFFDTYQTGPYLFMKSKTGLNITATTTSGAAYLIASNDAYVSLVGYLPPRLPPEADGFICRVGDARNPIYYEYDNSKPAWLECPAYGSPTGWGNMPMFIKRVGSTWTISNVGYEGRLAGDEETNPTPRFATRPLTGIGSYQGRLVLLSGPLVRLSAAGHPLRFYRSTVTSVLDSDPIEVGSSMNSSASYEYAEPFQKDLLLFSDSYQALIPSGNSAITPRNATVVVTSTYAADMGAEPVTTGRTMMFPAPRSADFFGVMEMIPSPYTDSQYVSQDATQHLPKYLGGRCRFAAASSVTGTVLFAPTGDTNALIVHEYAWDGDTKVQQSWHRWVFPYPVASAHFSGEYITILFTKNDYVLICSIDPRVGTLASYSTRRPFLDIWYPLTITNHTAAFPLVLAAFDPDMKDDLQMVSMSGDLAGERVGFAFEGSLIRTVPSWPSGQVAVGIPYRSSLVPTTPVVRDYKETAIHTGKHTLVRLHVGTQGSGEYVVRVKDRYSTQAREQAVSPIHWSSPELAPSTALIGQHAINTVPCRTNADSTVAEIYTNGLGELNVTSIEYVAKFHPKIKRR